MVRLQEQDIDEIVDLLKNDGVISVPTDTVYGICGKLYSKKVYNKIMMIKNRPLTKPLSIMCKDKEQIKSIVIVDEKTEKIIDKFMPGPITIILKKRPEFIDKINNKGLMKIDNVAIRMAPTDTLIKIINKLEIPIFMTSANKSGELTCKNIDEIEKICPGLDGVVEGSTLYNKESTIIDLSQNEIIIQREGPITKEEIMNILKK